MSEQSVNQKNLWQERRLEEILFANTDPVSKVQQIIRLGFDPEVADEIVGKYQIGQQANSYEYFEKLREYDDVTDEDGYV